MPPTRRTSRGRIQSDRAARWRTEMPSADVAEFERIAGDVLDELGYERGRAG